MRGWKAKPTSEKINKRPCEWFLSGLQQISYSSDDSKKVLLGIQTNADGESNIAFAEG